MADDDDSLHNEELIDLIREGLNKGVSENKERLVGLENDVIQSLRSESSPTSEDLFGRLSFPKLSLAGSAVFLVVIGLTIGFFLGSYIGNRPVATRDGSTFLVAYPEAEQVAIAGDFTNWKPQSLHQREKGLWAIKLELKPGRYEYNFIVDGQRWVPDPRASEYAQSYGQLSSVIYVGKSRDRMRATI